MSRAESPRKISTRKQLGVLEIETQSQLACSRSGVGRSLIGLQYAESLWVADIHGGRSIVRVIQHICEG